MLGFSDLHWRIDTPLWRREENYSQVLRHKLGAALDTGEKIVVAGDVFHRADDFEAVFDLLTFLLERQAVIFAVRGQHDMVLHNNTLPRTGFNLLARLGVLIPLTETPLFFEGQSVCGMGWGEHIPATPATVLVAHVPVSHGNAAYAGATAATAFRKTAGAFGVVLTGDNHRRFEVDGLYNAGCFHRMTIDLADQAPAAWRIACSGVSLFEIPCPAPVVNESYIETQHKGATRVAGAAFVAALAEARHQGGGDVFLAALKAAEPNTEGQAKVLLAQIIKLCEEVHT